MVLIIGAGLSGLSVARSLKDRGVRAELVDRLGVPGGAYARMYGDMRLTSPPAFLGLPGAPYPGGEGSVSAASYAAYLVDYAGRNGLRPRLRDVTRVARDASRFLVTFSDSSLPVAYDAVVVCTGVFGNPHVPAWPGIEAEGGPGRGRGVQVIHASRWRGAGPHHGRKVLIVGSGVSGIEIAEECVRAGLLPIVSARRRPIRLTPLTVLGVNPRVLAYPILRRLPLWSVRRFCTDGWPHRGIDRGFGTFLRQGRIDVRPGVRTASERLVTFTDGSSAEVDLIVLATGYRPDMPFLPDGMARGSNDRPAVRRAQSVAWPGLFFLGLPCASTPGSHFIHGITEDAQTVARTIAGHGSRPSAASS